jgi:hypothetical protein
MPRGTPKAIAPAVLQAIKLLADQGQSPSAVGREYGISKGRVSRIWASCEDEPAAGPAVKHEDKSTRKSGQFTVRVGKTAAAKLASSSGSSEYSDPLPALAPKASKKQPRQPTPSQTAAEFEVLAAAVQAQGGPQYADERTVDDAVALLTTLLKKRAISSAQYKRTLETLTSDQHQLQAEPRARKRAEPKRPRYEPSEYSESDTPPRRIVSPGRGVYAGDRSIDRDRGGGRRGAGLSRGPRGGNGGGGRDGQPGGSRGGEDAIEGPVRGRPDRGAPGLRPGTAGEPAQAAALGDPMVVQKRTHRM